MRKFVLLSLLVSILPLSAIAQDDMYFSPKKDKAEKHVEVSSVDRSGYYIGSNRSVDEYNRHGLSSRYQIIGNDTTASDVIDFYGNTPDSAYVGKKNIVKYGKDGYYDDDNDYSYARRMRYFDDFFWYDDPWLYGYPYYGPYYGYYGYGWGRPWRYGYYGYAGWYDPWYYGGYYGGWYDPWYYGWNRPYWGPSVAYRPYNRGGVTGTSNHGRVDNGRIVSSSSSRGYRGSNSTNSRNVDAYNRQNSNRDFSGYRGNNRNSSYNNRNNDFNNNMNRDFNNSGFRNESTFSNNSINRVNNSGFSGGGFSGGNRGGGFSGGGGRSGGGGHFGGRR